jgi:serine/threonine protein kinase
MTLDVRRARGPAAATLRHEVEMLQRARHPGVIEVRSVEDQGSTIEVVTRGGYANIADANLTSDERASAAEYLSTTVNDLHQIGVAHGALTLDNVLIDEHRLPVLTGFSHAVLIDHPTHPLARADNEALAAVITRLTGAPPALPTTRPTTPPTKNRPRRWIAASICGAIALGAYAVIRHPARRAPPLNYHGGVLSFRGTAFHVGEAGDVLAAGRWHCAATPTIALLRPQTGEIWTFATWPSPSHPIAAMPLATVSGADALATRSDGKCDVLLVRRRHAPTLVLKP